MNAESFSFTVGTIRCTAVSDGTFSYPSNILAANVPAERFDQELQDRGLPPREVVLPYSCLIIDTGRHRLLVDTGAGFAPTNGKLAQNLAAAGIAAAEIDTVILTHGHADHIGGTTDNSGAPAFPNARYVIWKSEWEFWTAAHPDLRAMPLDDSLKQMLVSYAHTKLPPIEAHLELIEREQEIVPGIQAIAAPGHTPGHMALLISSGADQLLHLADTVLHPILMEQPDWYPGVDLLPEQALATKRRLLERAASDSTLVFAYHLPFPGLGHVSRYRTGWQWQPIELPIPALSGGRA